MLFDRKQNFSSFTIDTDDVDDDGGHDDGGGDEDEDEDDDCCRDGVDDVKMGADAF